VEITCRVYRPRKPRESPLFQLVERHLEELLRLWPSRFTRPHGPLRPVVKRVLREFLRCGLLEHAFARLWCAECRRSVLVAFSCRGRSFCPSCEKKRQLLWAEWLCEDVLAKVAHRHVVLTIPRLLRPLFRRRRELLTELGRAAAEATSELVCRSLGDDARPGVVVSIATAGDLVQWHPHVHLLTTDGAKTADGSWQLLAWKHPGFSAHVGEPITPEQKLRLCDTAAYLVRNPLSLKKLVYLDGEKAVVYRSRMNPSLGRNFEAMDPLEWLARLSDHIPDPGQHCTRSCALAAASASASSPSSPTRWPSGGSSTTSASAAPRRRSRHHRCGSSSASPSTLTAGACRRIGTQPETPPPRSDPGPTA
jgi:hypothetical protein